MGIDQPGYQGMGLQPLQIRGLVFIQGFSRWQQIDNFPVVDGDRVIYQYRISRFDRNDPSTTK
jgi:hypothetical protein